MNVFKSIIIKSLLFQSELPTWRFNSRCTEIELWRAIAMCLSARRRISLLMKLDHSDAVNAALNKLLSFHITLSRYSIIKILQDVKFQCYRIYMLH